MFESRSMSKVAFNSTFWFSTWNDSFRTEPWFLKGIPSIYFPKKLRYHWFRASNFMGGFLGVSWDSQTSGQWELRCKALKVALWPTKLGLPVAGTPDCWCVFFFFFREIWEDFQGHLWDCWTCDIEDSLPLGIFRNNKWSGYWELRNQLSIFALDSLGNVGAMMA